MQFHLSAHNEYTTRMQIAFGSSARTSELVVHSVEPSQHDWSDFCVFLRDSARITRVTLKSHGCCMSFAQYVVRAGLTVVLCEYADAHVSEHTIRVPGEVNATRLLALLDALAPFKLRALHIHTLNATARDDVFPSDAQCGAVEKLHVGRVSGGNYEWLSALVQTTRLALQVLDTPFGWDYVAVSGLLWPALRTVNCPMVGAPEPHFFHRLFPRLVRMTGAACVPHISRTTLGVRVVPGVRARAFAYARQNSAKRAALSCVYTWLRIKLGAEHGFARHFCRHLNALMEPEAWHPDMRLRPTDVLYRTPVEHMQFSNMQMRVERLREERVHFEQMLARETHHHTRLVEKIKVLSDRRKRRANRIESLKFKRAHVDEDCATAQRQLEERVAATFSD